MYRMEWRKMASDQLDRQPLPLSEWRVLSSPSKAAHQQVCSCGPSPPPRYPPTSFPNNRTPGYGEVTVASSVQFLCTSMCQQLHGQGLSIDSHWIRRAQVGASNGNGHYNRTADGQPACSRPNAPTRGFLLSCLITATAYLTSEEMYTNILSTAGTRVHSRHTERPSAPNHEAKDLRSRHGM
jgi:hypothetical protein